MRTIRLAINVYHNGQGRIPDDCVEVLLNAAKALEACRYAKARIALVVDPRQKSAIEQDISALGLAGHDLVELRHSQRFPMIGDILRSAGSVCETDDYLCYVNSDINLTYWFFDLVSMLIGTHREGTGFIINRKDLVDVDADLTSGEGFHESIYHPGFDCFVFPRQLLESAHFGTCTVGYPPIGALVATNMLHLLPEVRLLSDSLITWHRGDGQRMSQWSGHQQAIQENRERAYRALDKLRLRLESQGLELSKSIGFSRNFLNRYFAFKEMASTLT